MKGIRNFACTVAMAVMCSSITPAFAQKVTVGDWIVQGGGGWAGAATTSTTGAELGVMCSASATSCLFYIDSTSQCDNGESYPILLNGPNGANNLVATCRIITLGSNTFDALVISPFDTVEGALTSDGQLLGFAEPMQNGAFRIYRFSTTGAAQAIKVAATEAAQPVGDQVQ